MKNTLYTILFLLSTTVVFSQSKIKYKDKPLFDQADFAFYQGDYGITKDIFEEFVTKYPTNETVIYEYGASLLNLGMNLDTAETYLNEAMKLGMKEALFDYGMALYKNEKLEDAIRVFQSYRMLSKKERTEDEIYDQVAAVHQAIKMMQSPVDVVVTNLGPKVNTQNSEYTPILTGDSKNLYFTSRREDSEGGLLDPNGAYFEDIYYSKKDSIWNQAVRLDSTINTKTHDATVALSADGSVMVIYRTNKILTGGDLYITYKDSTDKWSIPKKMNDNINTKYQESSACLSYNGQVMYFTSNRPGGMGGKDIYITRMLPNNEWSKAQNLGPMINTPKDEDSPFLNITSTALYFSSNGHRTMGGFDIFKSEKVFNDWSFPENMGYPINTVNDELYLALDETEFSGYYSSSKVGGFGQQDIYQIDFIYREAKDLVVKGLVMNENSIPIVATIKLYNQEKDQEKEIGTYLTNKNTGKYIMALHPLIKYKIVISSEGYEDYEDYLYYDKLSFDLLEYDIELQQLIAK